MTKSTPAIHLAALFILMVLGGLLFYLAQKQITTTNRLQAQVNQLSADQAKLEDLAASIPSLSTQAQTWLKSLPATEEEVAIFAATAEQQARSQGMTITLDFEDFPQPIVVFGQNVDGLELSLALEGSFQGLSDFLYQLSASQYFYKIDKLTIIQHETRPGIKATINGALVTNFNPLKL